VCVLSIRPNLALLSATIMTIVATTGANAQFAPPNGPQIKPPGRTAVQLDTLMNRYETGKASYACWAADARPDGAMCFLEMPCTTGMTSITRGTVDFIGINFATYDANDPRCIDPFFMLQARYLLEDLAGLPAPRAREIVVTMDKNPQGYAQCALDKLGALPEGRGCLNHSRDDAAPLPPGGKRPIKLFNWHLKQG
jgi:hypothetical protein